MTLPTIAIALGDPSGIGPEIAIKAALHPRVCRACVPLLVGDVRTAQLHAQACGIDTHFNLGDGRLPAPYAGRSIPFLHLDLQGEQVELGEVRALHGLAAVAAARRAIEAALQGRVDAVVACPQNELAIKQAGIEFDGYPSFVARCTGTPIDDVFLMICFDDKRIVHVTLHVSLRRAIELVTLERVSHAIEVTAATLRRLGVAVPRIAVSGLNPHAGEHGMFGSEDAEIIAPAIERARGRGIHVDGPIGADILMERRGYDAFVVMFHDQGHIAAKLLAPRRTAALAIGSPVLFSSVAHGTALDIAGKNQASPAAVIEAIERLAHAAGVPST
jgi:4-hydroxy-L-threonine phosphate dehydrogenase PdxA